MFASHAMPRRRAARLRGTAVAALALVSLTACIGLPPSSPADVGVPITDEEHGERVQEHWDDIDPALQDAEQSIIMSFSDLPTDPDDVVWEEMFFLELAVGEALLDAGVGYLDGNGSDGEIYEVFYWGNDHEAMWSIIEPMYADAPLAWSEVQGWVSFEAEEPALVLTR